MDDDYYDTAQICLRGHVVTIQYNRRPELRQKFCTKCGERTITTCQSCGNPIMGLPRGYTRVGGVTPKPPLYCHECGKPYPWTDAILKAAHELADEAPNLSDEEREHMKEDINDIVRNTLRSPVAASRFSRLAAKAGKATMSSFKELLTNIASDILVKLVRGW